MRRDWQDLEIRAELSGIALGATEMHVDPIQIDESVFRRPVRLETDGPDVDGVPHEWMYPRLVFNEGIDEGFYSVPEDADWSVVSEKIEIPDKGGRRQLACLDEFIRLPDASPADAQGRVLSMARFFGPLGICRHRKPATHRGVGDLCTHLKCPRYQGEQTHWEPVEAWLRYARQLRGILSAAIDLQVGRPVCDEDWTSIVGGEPVGYLAENSNDESGSAMILVEDSSANQNIDNWRVFIHPDDPKSSNIYDHSDYETFKSIATINPLWFDKSSITRSVRTWLRYGNIEPQIYWFRDGVRIQLDSSLLWYRLLPARLGLQLVATLQSPSGMYRCEGCSLPFTPPVGQRRPARNKRKWCPSCGRHAQWAAYQRRRYKPRSTESDTLPNATIGSTGDPTVSNPVSNDL